MHASKGSEERFFQALESAACSGSLRSTRRVHEDDQGIKNTILEKFALRPFFKPELYQIRLHASRSEFEAVDIKTVYMVPSTQKKG